MSYWSSAPLTLLGVVVLLALAALVRSLLPAMGRWPDAMVAGFLGLTLGASGSGWLPLDVDVLESVVYHGLALLFIASALRPQARARAAGSVRGFAFALPMLVALQSALGMGLVFAWTAGGRPLHPGVGLMVPLGFSQGPGQALALGSAWEAQGMVDGAQLGLIMAAMGFVACLVGGVPMVAVARRRGWLDPSAAHGAHDDEAPTPGVAAGDMEPLTRQVAAIGAVYAATAGLLHGGAWALGDRPQAVATLFGFHFIVGALLAIGVRRGLTGREVLDDRLLGRLAALLVDVVTVAAIAAIEVRVLGDWWLVIGVFSGLAGALTAAASLWLARRAFPEAPFEFALVLFGSATGTLATGLALLRLTDPELRGPVASGAVLGSAASAPLSIPLLLLLQIPVSGWPDRHPQASWLALALLAVYALALALGWWRVGGFRWLRPTGSLWPPEPGG